MRGNPREDLRLDELERDLQVGLGASIMGLEFVDRDLELEADLRVDYVGLDTRGRLLLVLLVDEDDDATALKALDVLAYARENLELLGRHLTEGRLRADLGPLVVLVAERFSTRLVARLQPLGEVVRLFEVRELRSSSGSASYLVPVSGGELVGGEQTSGDPVDFVTTLPAEVRDLGFLAMRRVSRIDPEMECRSRTDGLVWRFDGEEICSLTRTGAGLIASISAGGTRVNIRGPRDVDRFVEAALERTFEREMDSPRRYSDGQDEELDDLDDDSLEDRSLLPGGGPILTEEEIQAFQQ